MTFRVVLEFDPDTNSYSAVCPELPGCASAGDTEEEARANIREAIELYLAPAEINLPENAKLVEVTVG
jgi:predicted RNase H-like HicB family nuclease